MTLQTFLSYVLYDLGEPADWQHVINGAAYSYNYSYVGYQEADNYCRKNGGKVFEPTETTNNPVSKWAQAKIQQTKMFVTCQRFGDWFLFGLVWPYSSNQKNIMEVGAKSLLLTCSSNITLSLPSLILVPLWNFKDGGS